MQLLLMRNVEKLLGQLSSILFLEVGLAMGVKFTNSKVNNHNSNET